MAKFIIDDAYGELETFLNKQGEIVIQILNSSEGLIISSLEAHILIKSLKEVLQEESDEKALFEK